MTDLVPIPSPGVPMYFGQAGEPLVVIVHDWYGRLPWLENYATALASKGFRVVVPDLYNGVATVEEATAETLMSDLALAEALAILDDAIDEGRLEGSPKVGIVGFSMGGWLTLLHAQGGSADAVVAYYATLGTKDHGVIPSPLLLHLAETDEWGEGEDPASFVLRLKDHGTPIAQHSYLGTVHSFANASIPAKVDANAAALAFARTAVFLEKHLLE